MEWWFPGTEGRRPEKFLFYGFRVSVWEDENVLEWMVGMILQRREYEHLKLCGPYDLRYNYSALPLKHENNQNHFVNK